MHNVEARPLEALVAGLCELDLQRCRDGAVGELLRIAAAAKPILPIALATSQPRAYTRTLLFRNDDFELLALYWPSGASTPIHDHGGRRCWLTLVDGAMQIENYLRTDDGTRRGYAALARQDDVALAPGDVDLRSNDRELHRCIALVPETTTFHIYARPLAEFNVFNHEAATYTECTPNYDKILAIV
ncbi:MAG TPA: hypothetical protein VIG32_11155 [Candidatus Baltobacteraceae bacterium]|jgi:predicted metal-dependent enzyme (double-stranded beta helix superfamily)